MDAGELVSAFGSSWGAFFPQLLQWMIYFVYFILVVVVVLVIYTWLTYDFKVTVFKLYGSGKDNAFSFSQPKKNRVRWNKKDNVWNPLFPLFNNRELEPFSSEYIYPGKQVFAFELENEWIPGRINIHQSEKTLRAEINPIPYYIRNWMGLQLKKNAIEFAEHDWWSDNKTIFIALICGIACLVAVVLTVYFTYQHADKVVMALNGATNSLNNFNVIPGAPN